MGRSNGRKIRGWAAKVAALVLLTAFWFCLPRPLFKRPLSFVLEDRSGGLLGASIAGDGQWRFPAGDSVPDKFKKCITTFEDKRFYHHPGIDVIALARAVRQNFRAGKVVSGGSTITMQVIRLATGNRRTVANKLLEAFRALRLELTYRKDSILSLYAANAPFGSNVVGLEAASWRYFGRGPAQLSWGETASLAVLPNSPALVHPGRNRTLLLQKRNRLIDALANDGIINSQEARLAKLEPVPDRPFPLPQAAPHLLQLAKKDFSGGRLESTRLKSSIDGPLQQEVTTILNNHHGRLSANGVSNLAALVLDIETGRVLSYNGNIFEPQHPELESHVDMIQALRSPGSTLKPLLYMAMLNEGMLLPNSLVPDIPTQIAGYQPNNYDLGYDGAVPASRALARSLNVPAVKMLQQYKYERFHDMLHRCGMTTLTRPPDFYGLSLILGGCEVKMWELAGIYGSMARYLNHSVTNKKAQIEWRMPDYRPETTAGNGPERNDTYQPGPAAIWYTFQAMNEVMRPGEEQLWQQFSSSRKIAWKTGTSFGFRDAWAVGLTPDHLVVVWAGNADGEGRPGLTGIDAAAPVLFDIFRLLPATGDWFSTPRHDMVQTEVCTESGFRASDLCRYHETMPVPKAGLKTAACPYNQLVHLDKTGRWQVTDECEPPGDMVHQPWFVLPPAMEHYYKTKNYSYRPLPPFRPDCRQDGSSFAPMELIYPKANARVYIPLEIGGARGQVIFSAAHRKTGEVIHWHLDDRYIGSTGNVHQIALNPPAGKHRIALVDQEGNRLEQSFTVLDKEKQ